MRIIRCTTTLLAALVLFGPAGCGDDAALTATGNIASIDLAQANVTLPVGQVRQLAAIVKDENGAEITNADLTWTSRNTGVATVDGQGLLRGVSAGNTMVTVASGSFRDSAAVTVINSGSAAELELAYSSFVGGSSHDAIRDVATDAQGNMYVTGGTQSPNFPTTAGVVQRTHNPGSPEAAGIDEFDVFIMKIDPTGRVVWSTLLGGPNYDRAYGIEVDAQGFIYIAGRAGRGFPVTSAAFQTAFQGGQEAAFYGPQDGFVCKLRPDASAVVFCSYFGTPDPRIIRDLAVDAAGNIYLASGWSSGNYPAGVAAAFTNSRRGDDDAVIAKIRPDGGAVLWATYIGGSARESNQNSVAVDGAGNPYMLLTTNSADAPVSASAYQTRYGGNGDMLVTRLNPSNGALVWASYLGGSQNESTETHEFTVDRQGNAYVAAPTLSSDFPTTPGAFQRTLAGMHDVFVSKLSPDGTRLIASTLVGGIAADRPEGVTVDNQGNVYFTGTTTSNNFPVTPGAFQSNLRGQRDAIAVKLAPDFSHLLYSTYFGGSGDEYGRGAAVGAGGFYFGGDATSTDWPLLSALQTSFGGGNADAILVRLEPGR